MNIARLLLAMALVAVCSKATHAQSREDEKYRKISEEIRQQVWAWDKPQFKRRDVPAELANASKVILAQHTELTAETRSKFAFYVITFGIKKEQTITEVARELVKLNDKTAVDEYSELSFKQLERQSGFYSRDKTVSYVGVRVIKPSGVVKEINADDIVLTKNEKTEKRAKLAIPDLQPGDMVDYFIATEQLMTNDFADQYYQVVLFDAAPVLSQSFHAQLSKKYAVQYRSYNGAPELQVTKNDDDEIIMDVQKTNMPASETALWVAPARQQPYIRMTITPGNAPGRQKELKRPGTVTKDLDYEEVIGQTAVDYSTAYFYSNTGGLDEYAVLEKTARKKAIQMNIDYNTLTIEEKAALLYYTLRFEKIINFEMGNLERTLNIASYEFNGLAFPFYKLLKAGKLDPAIIVSATRTGCRMQEIMYTRDIRGTAFLPSINKYVNMESVFDVPFVTPSDIEGVSNTKSFTLAGSGITPPSKPPGYAKITEGGTVVVSPASDNAHIENIQLSVAPDKTNLDVKRSTTIKGHYKVDLQKQLILYEDFYEYERKAFNEPKSLIETLQDNKRSIKFAEEVENAFAEKRKLQKDAFISEANSWFDQEISNLKDYKVDSLGVRHTQPNLVYSSTFQLGGMLKKAGNNIIVEIGRIQGQPLKVKEEQRKRSIDVYMSFARTIEYNVTLDIPDGYTAEGVAALNRNVENETGVFKVVATSTDKQVSIKVTKQYLHGYEPVANWEKMLQFLDASTDWVNAKLLLKKK